MARDELGIISLGKTAGVTVATDQVHLEGVEKWFQDDDLVNPPKRRTDRWKRCRIVRNVSGVAILPKRLVTFKAGTNGKHIDGYAEGIAEWAVVSDEWLPSAGVANNDLFWVTLQGPSNCTTSPAAAAENFITEGDLLISNTAAASTFSTTAGRVVSATFTSTHATGVGLHSVIRNSIGRALSAKTTANTDADVLVDVNAY